KGITGTPRQEGSMHHRIVSILRRLEKSPAQQLDRPEILGACRQINHTYLAQLPPRRVAHPLVPQPDPPCNTAITNLVRISGHSPTASAYCQARSRLPLAVLQELLRRIADRIRPEIDDYGKWLGHRVFVADGSSFSMPDVPELQEHFGQS